MNGILVAQSDYGLINNIEIDKEGNVLVGYFKEHKIVILNPSIQRKIKEIKFNVDYLCGNNDLEKGDNIPIFQTFHYQPLNDSIYCFFSNGNLIKKFIGKEQDI